MWRGEGGVILDKERLKQRVLHEDFNIYLEELIDANLIEDEVALGISKYILSNGARGLSDKQWYVFLEKGLIPNYVEYCERCAEEIPWTEMLGTVYINEDDLCGYCHHISSKD